MSVLLRGVAAAPGLALGKASLWQPRARLGARPAGSHAAGRPGESGARPDNAATDAMAHFRKAAARVSAELAELERALTARAGADAAAILGAQALIAQDPELAADVEARVSQGVPLVEAVIQGGEQLAAALAALDDEYLRQRSLDVRDVAERIVVRLTSEDGDQPPALPYEATIVVAHELSPALLARLDPARLKGIVTVGGGVSDHTALLAKGLGIPAVLGCPDALSVVQEGDQLAVDGAAGTGLVRPNPGEARGFQGRIRRQASNAKALAERPRGPTVTTSGRRVILMANLASAREVPGALAAGAEGVGLYRTEFLFLGRTTLPSEEEQLVEYRTVAELMAPRPVVIRTLDVGGDKHLSALPLPAEANPQLGWRGIRLWLARPDLAVPQARALLRAARFGAIEILLPMVINPDEIRQARALIESARAELGDAAGPYRLGAMIEVPAAALTVDRLAAEVDFFSIGTNDLVQYTLAVDRGNLQVAELYDAQHPAVLRLVELAVQAAHARGKRVSVCGDAARDPRLIPHLVALGVDELSMPSSAIPGARAQLARL